MEQDKDSVYGVITKINDDDWVYVDWIDEEGNIICTNNYEIGYDNTYSLYEYDSKLNNKNQKTNRISEIMENTKQLSVTKTETVQIGKTKREITITVLVDNGRVRAGYSVRNPEDKKTNPELAKQISTGRALSDKTNLVDMVMGIGMDRKYILYAIAEQLFREIGSGKIQIKGIK